MGKIRPLLIALALGLVLVLLLGFGVQPAAAPDQNDMGTGGDAGYDFSTAATLTLPASGTGYLTTLEKDFYKFNVTAGQIINISLSPPSGVTLDIEFYNPDQSYYILPGCGNVTATASWEYTAPSTGYYYMRINVAGLGYATETGTYSLSITAASQNDMGTGGDAGNDSSLATALTPPASGTGHFDLSDITDYYKFYVESKQKIVVNISPPSDWQFGAYIALYNPTSSEVDSSWSNSITHIATSSGYYGLVVEGETGTYSLSIGIDEPISMTFTFLKPDGTPLAYEDIYWSMWKLFHACISCDNWFLGATDSNGRIETTAPLTTMYFGNSDGSYRGSATVTSGMTSTSVQMKAYGESPSGFGISFETSIYLAAIGLPIACAGIVAWDSNGRPMNRAAWAVLAFLLSIIGLIIYLVARKPRRSARIRAPARKPPSLTRKPVKAPPPKKAPSPRMFDRALLGYIAERGGEISIPGASKELGVSKREVRAALERLKRAGKLEEE